jgi:hypothetical protein
MKSKKTEKLNFIFKQNILYLPRILLTQPCDTRNCRLISHGLTPCLANSTIDCRTPSGKGRPLTKIPPS